jgi:hypothetical protein
MPLPACLNRHDESVSPESGWLVTDELIICSLPSQRLNSSVNDNVYNATGCRDEKVEVLLSKSGRFEGSPEDETLVDSATH